MSMTGADKNMTGIKSWKKFRTTVRSSGYELFHSLGEFPDAVLVTGCQRSGTTILARIISQSEGMRTYAFTDDDELDAALILSGQITGMPNARYCFQTTYMYDHLNEYVERVAGQKIIWVLRNPRSVVCSMLYNWKTSALNELFMGCGIRYLTEPYRYRLQRFGALGVPRLIRASLSYRAKLDEVFFLRDRLPESVLTIVDYDDMVNAKHRMLPDIYANIGLDYKPEYGERLRSTSLEKASRLADDARMMIDAICLDIYQSARRLINIKADL